MDDVVRPRVSRRLHVLTLRESLNAELRGCAVGALLGPSGGGQQSVHLLGSRRRANYGVAAMGRVAVGCLLALAGAFVTPPVRLTAPTRNLAAPMAAVAANAPREDVALRAAVASENVAVASRQSESNSVVC